MDLKVFLILTSFAIIARAAVLKNGIHIPTYAQICRRSQKNFDDCLKGSLQTLIQKIGKDGIPAINLPPLDPWKVEQFHVKNSGDPLKIGLTFTNSNTHGFSNIKILALRSNFNNPKQIELDVDFHNKQVLVNGNYLAEGYISDLPIHGKGKYSGTISNVTGTLKIRGHIVQRDGEEFLQIDRSIMRPTIGDMKIQMSNENNKYPELNNLLVSLLNQFWRPIYEEALPYFQNISDDLMTSRFNEATLKIPYDQLLPN
uniref:Secreted Juvenile haemolymph binding protein-like protein n=1 Tax=Pristhesancus plagipennis TaxID=1955184 RepID=A0A2K8JP11_PRIPG|nr:secreted Juvenile haemolymph binding protein-like protein [Pristhesancus plagipennis]